MHVDRVDYRLLVQNAIKNRLVELATGKYSPLEVDKSFENMVAMGSHIELGALKVLEEAVEERVAAVAANFLLRVDSDLIIEPVLALLHNSKVSDVSKGQLLRLLNQQGFEVSDIMSPSIFKDVTKLASDSMVQLLQDLHESPSILGYILEEFAEFPPEMQFGYVQDLIRTKDFRVVPLLENLARHNDEVIASEAIRGLGSVPDPSSLGALEGLVLRIVDPFLLKLADREARRLRFKGIKPITVPVASLGDPYHVVVSGIDGKGCRIVWLARFLKGSRGRLMAVSFLLSTQEGLKDCYGSTQLSRKESQELLKNLKSKYATVDGDITYASELVRDALYTTRHGNLPLPPQWTYWQQVFSSMNISPKPFVFMEGVEQEAFDGQSYKDLLGLEELSEWYEEDSLVYDAAEEMLRIGKKFRSPRVKQKAADDVVNRVATELFQPRLGELIRRLDFTSEFLRRRGKTPDADILATVARALREGEPPQHNVFLRNLLTLSIGVAEHNLRAGFDVRNNVDMFE
ncbi:MAG: hypothetical protein FD169_2218 [Bacillota bacterium]|nr:MAG: hypothetical protein FD169_2218 [Bacillota bacterium]MBS3950529.1 HEAT repeat domain-containing protein [Peptococcaceae bacterium]